MQFIFTSLYELQPLLTFGTEKENELLNLIGNLRGIVCEPLTKVFLIPVTEIHKQNILRNVTVSRYNNVIYNLKS